MSTRTLILATIFFICLVTAIVWTSINEVNKEYKEKESALEGCIRCKIQVSGTFYFYDCNSSKYIISMDEWVNINASICE